MNEKKSSLSSPPTTLPPSPHRPIASVPPKRPSASTPAAMSSSSLATPAHPSATSSSTTTATTAGIKPALTPKIFAQQAKTFVKSHQDLILEGASMAVSLAEQSVPSEVQAVFVVLNVLFQKAQEARSNKAQCAYLTKRAQSVISYLVKIDESKLKTESSLRRALEEFKDCLEKCVEQVSKFGRKTWVRRVVQSGVDAGSFNELNAQLSNAISALNLGMSVQVATSHQLSEEARKKDQDALCAQVKEILSYQKETLLAQQKTNLTTPDQEKTLSLNLQASLVQLSEKMELNTKAQHDFLQNNLKQLVDARFTEMESDVLAQTAVEPSYIAAKKEIAPQLLIPFNAIGIQHVIKHGTTSTIYQGQWCHHAIALKLLEGEKSTDYALFVREVEIMSRLRHPNVTQLYGVCLDPKPCLVMELMSGGSLEMKLEEGALTEVQCCEIAQDVASGLLYLHQRHMYHRDLKTANILLNAQGQAKLSDFGLSKVHDATIKTAGITGFDKEWIAPEVLRAERSAGLRGTLHKKSVASAASDVYSFGLVLWSMLTGKKPLADVQDDLEKCSQIIEGRIDLTVNRAIPEAIQSVILHCCATDFSDRPDMEEVFDSLLQWQKTLNPDLSPRSLCVQGREHEKNQRPEQAVQCFQKAADQNFADGLYKLGQAFFSGMGCTQDNAQGFACMQKAATQGHLLAVYNLGRAYDKGIGCSPNPSQALFWYQKAAAGDDAAIKKQAQEKLASLSHPS